MKPQAGDIYHHYKSPDKHYKIIGIAFHTETTEEMVVYQPLYETDQEFFVRPLKMFMEEVEVNGEKKSRFTKVS
jgi:hypothetical protein